jgi:NitT/TauT family transport system substrate-binding protein
MPSVQRGTAAAGDVLKKERFVMMRMSAQFGRRARPFGLLTGMVLFAVASVPALAQQKVSIGIVSSLTDLTFYIAEQKGYFAEEGIVPDYIKFTSGTQMVAPLATGELNVASGSITAALFNAATRGIPIKIVADKGSMKPGYGFMPLMVRKDLVQSGRVKTIADLRGMKVASSAKGGQADVALQRALQKVGLAFSDVDAVYMGHTELVAALQNGAIDAALATEPDATISEDMGGSVRFMTGDLLYPDEQLAVLMYSPDFIAKSRETGTKFMRAYLRAARDYNDALVDGKIAGPGSAELIALLAQKMEINDPAILERMSAYGLDPNGELNVEGMRNDLELYREWGLIQGDPSVDQVVDQSFLQAARASLPAYEKASGSGNVAR